MGVEALLAYYGIGDEQVEISPARDRMTMYGLSGEKIIEVPLEEDQWIEVNWFSSWGELSNTDELNKLAKKYYAEENFDAYLSLMPDLFRLTLNRVDGIDLAGNESLLETMKNLGMEEDLIITAEKLLQKPFVQNKKFHLTINAGQLLKALVTTSFPPVYSQPLIRCAE